MLRTESVKVGSHIAKAAVKQMKGLGPGFTAVAEVMQLLSDENSTPADWDRSISRDPVLAAQILKTVNSSFYGLSRKIGQISQAVVLLGPKAITSIVLANSVASLMKQRHMDGGINPADFRLHSIAVACAAKELAKQSRVVSPEDAFTAGIVHDIGLVVEMRVFRSTLAKVLEIHERDGQSLFSQLEREHLGATHEEFGEELCRDWRFPDWLLNAVRNHHHPWDLAEEIAAMPTVIHVADIVAVQAQLGISLTVEHDHICAELLDFLNINESIVDTIVSDLPGQTADILNVLG